MWRIVLAAAAGLLAAQVSGAQGVTGDLLAGKLIDPEVGQWAWYDLTDTDGENRYMVRQAVVGSERVGRRTGYWVEFEIVPELGYRSIYKMLLTGPASDPRNIHRIQRRVGLDPIEEMPVAQPDEADAAEQPEARRDTRGTEQVETPTGMIEAERFVVAQEGYTVDLWINEDVLPTGIVRMRSPQGEMLLRAFGMGGRDGQSRLDQAGSGPEPEGPGQRPGPDARDDGGDVDEGGRRGAAPRGRVQQ